MPTVMFGNESVLEPYKPDPDVNIIKTRPRPELGRQVTTMFLVETDINEQPSLPMNVAMAVRFWANDSDQPPSWVECPENDLLAQVIAQHFGCPVGRPKKWKAG